MGEQKAIRAMQPLQPCSLLQDTWPKRSLPVHGRGGSRAAVGIGARGYTHEACAGRSAWSQVPPSPGTESNFRCVAAPSPIRSLGAAVPQPEQPSDQESRDP